MKFATNEFIKALKNAKWNNVWADEATLHEMSFDVETRNQILAYRNALASEGIVLLDHEIAAIWEWHSTNLSASWLIMGDPKGDLRYFEEFVNFWIDKNEGHLWI